MTPLLNVLSAEALKARRTSLLWLTLLCPAAVMGLIFLVLMTMKLKTPAPTAAAQWNFMVTQALNSMSIFFISIYIAIAATVHQGIEHKAQAWKQVFAMPVPRWSIYLGKALFFHLMLIGSQLLFFVLMILTGIVAQLLRPGLGLSLEAMPLSTMALGTGLMMMSTLSLAALHTALAIRIPSFGVSIALALVGFVSVTLMMRGSEYVVYNPYAFAMYATLRGMSENFASIPETAWYSLGSAVVFTGLGGYLYLRQDVR